MPQENLKPQPETESGTTAKERLKEITDSIEKGIKEVFESESYKQYLQTMSRFHNYSVNNQMLIYMQNPNATLVAGYNKWKDKFGRNVIKGQKGIKIIAPTPYKKKIETQKLDPETKLPIFDKDGNPIIEEKAVQIPVFKPVSVFDVSQTEGKPLPELAKTLYGEVKNYDILKEAVTSVSPVPITFEDLALNNDGAFIPSKQQIKIRNGMSEVQEICAMIHEITHSILHNPETNEEKKSRSNEEVEAESVSYAVCKYFGIDTDENSFGYLASWSSGKEVKELRESLDTISETSSKLITEIERKYKSLLAERDKQNVKDITFKVSDLVYLQMHRLDDNANIDYAFYDQNKFKLIESGYTEFTKDEKLYGASLSELAKQIVIDYELNTDDITVADKNIENAIAEANKETEPEKIDFKPKEDEITAIESDYEDNVSNKYESRFFNSKNDMYAIYQLNENNSDLLFLDASELEKEHIPIEKSNYSCVYSGNLLNIPANNGGLLDSIYEKFNVNKPGDFKGHSVSTSDILAIKQDDKVSYSYVNNIGFVSVKDFGADKEKTAGLSIKDSADMVDRINNGKAEEEPKTVKTDADKQKDSLLGKLKKYQVETAKPDTQVKKKERGLEN